MRALRVLLRLLLCLPLLSLSAADAQNSAFGDFTGTVQDTTGQRIRGAQVLVKNLATGETARYTTDSVGIYDTVASRPGRYLLEFEAPGFARLVRGPVSLPATTVTLNALLQVGAVQQSVEVNATALLLNADGPEQATDLSFEPMLALPQVGAYGQDWQNLLILLPGTAGAPSAPQGVESPGMGLALNGSLPYNSSILQDGSTVTLPASENSDPATFETVSEIIVNSSSFSAEYSTGASVMNQITKGGTNQFHGAAYEYFQNDALDARSYFDDPSSRLPKLRFDQFGGSISGPILRSRLFFYFNFDKTVDNGTSNGFVTVPTLDERQGDFSDVLGGPALDNTGQPQINPCDGSTMLTNQIFDPSTLRTVGGVPCRTAFKNNTLPSVSPVASALETYYPAPNRPGFANNYYFSLPQPNPSTRYFGRLDYKISQAHGATLSATERDNHANYPSEFPCPINCQNDDTEDYLVQMSETWVVNPHTVNQARFGFNRQANRFVPDTLGLGIPAKVGLQYAKADLLPSLNISGGVGECCENLLPSANYIAIGNSFDASEDLALVLGRHILHLGGEVIAYQLNATPYDNVQAGDFTFTGVYTQATQSAVGTGYGYADFLLGDVEAWSANNQSLTGGRQKSYQFFLQDDWKLSTNLTINLGIRYQIQGGWNEIEGREGTFDPVAFNSVADHAGAMWFAGLDGRTQLQKTVFDTFLPRAGFAWTLHPQTVLRAGYGIYAEGRSADTYGDGLGFGSNSYGSATDQTDGLTPLVNLSDSGATLPYLAASTSPVAYNGQNVDYNPHDTPVATLQEWTVSLQHQLGGQTLAELAYVGNHGSRLPFPRDINQVPSTLLASNDSPGSRPYPQFESIQGDPHDGYSNYNALQISAQGRLRNGMSFLANYTWSHFLNTLDSAGWGSHGGIQDYQNSFDVRANYGPSNFDIRHALKVGGVYELPLGRKGLILRHATGVAASLVEGWRLSLIGIAQSGGPFTITYGGSDLSYSQAGNWRPNLIGNPARPFRNIAHWFNAAAFAVPAPATFGDLGRNTLVGPSLTELNFSLGKTFRLAEGAALEIRCDAANVLNHPSFGTPDTNFDDPVDTTSDPGRPNGAGTISTTTVAGRRLQLGARLSF